MTDPRPGNDPTDGPNDREDGLVQGVRVRRGRVQRWLHEGEPSVARNLARIGVLGWIIVVPSLVGILLGHWLDRIFATGIFWTAPLLFAGLALGCWSAWKWVRES
ncbi:MAG: AtpZ/AtpI family protein [Acetobacteraceae bacterium]